LRGFKGESRGLPLLTIIKTAKRQLDMSKYTSAVEYLASKESEIVPTKFEVLAAMIKQDIESNAFGDMLKFPAEKKLTGHEGRFDAVKRRATIDLVNQYRDKGMNGRDACGAVGVPYSSYSTWSNKLRVPYRQK